MNFSEKLKKHRKELGMSQEELSFQLNVSRQAVSKWENGQGFPETDKLLQLSNLFGVSLDYLLKEDPNISADENEKGYYASRETVEGFLISKAAHAQKVAIAVAIMVFSLSFPILIESSIGTALFMCAVALGVGILVLNGFSPKRYKDIERNPLVFDSNFYKEFQETHYERRKQHGLKIVLGIVIILMSVISLILVEDVFLFNDDKYAAIIPIAVSFAVYLFITSGSAIKCEKIILNNEECIKEFEMEKKYNWIYGCVMPLAAMVFLAIGFKTNLWHPAWLVFPVTALSCNFFISIINSKKS